MNIQSIFTPDKILGILRFPLIRLPLLGGILFYGMVISNGYMKDYKEQPLMALFVVLAMVTLALAIYIGFVYFVERRPVSELSLAGAGREFGSGLLVGTGLYTAAVIILMLLGYFHIDGLNPWPFMLFTLPMAISSAFFEELFFRGVVFRVTEEYLGSWIALIVASLIFGLVHLSNPDATLEGALFISIEAGVLLVAVYMLTRRLWMAIGFHMSFNFTQASIFSGETSGNAFHPGLLRTVIEGPELLTGGKFGLESSLIVFLLCTATGIFFLVKAVRRGHIIQPTWKRNSK